jgi:uncharacterized membrane protein YkvA (DUF1232 family)
MREWIAALRERAEELEDQVHALYLAYRDPRTPWYAKAWAMLVVAYALSPIDLIPDFIPVLGYLDDLVLVPLGIWVALRLVPVPVMDECRVRAQRAREEGPPRSRLGALIIVAMWIAALALVGLWLWRRLG